MAQYKIDVLLQAVMTASTGYGRPHSIDYLTVKCKFIVAEKLVNVTCPTRARKGDGKMSSTTFRQARRTSHLKGPCRCHLVLDLDCPVSEALQRKGEITQVMFLVMT